jgi:hypothetical protein
MLNSRGPFIILGVTVSMVGYIIAYTSSKPGPGYAAAVIAACGVFPTIPVALAWAGGNAGGDMKRGVVLAMVIGIGNLGACVPVFESLVFELIISVAFVPHLYITNLRDSTKAMARF